MALRLQGEGVRFFLLSLFQDLNLVLDFPPLDVVRFGRVPAPDRLRQARSAGAEGARFSALPQVQKNVNQIRQFRFAEAFFFLGLWQFVRQVVILQQRSCALGIHVYCSPYDSCQAGTAYT